jgi:uncharacterized RDD family membrane protein YckC
VEANAQETASWVRRALALCVDWAASTLVVVAVGGLKRYTDDPLSGIYVLGVYVLENAFLTALAGGSFGKLVTRLRVVRVGETRPINLIAALLRSLLIALVIPPLVFRPDGRGLHDLVARSVTIPLPKRR